jgi:DegV family protein with EDD domain
MPGLHVVTDSGAAVGSLLTNAKLPVTVLQNTASTSDTPTRNGGSAWVAPILPPRSEDYARAFVEVSRGSEGILCITPSRHISAHWERAKAGVVQAAGACPVRIFDSHTLSAAQALLTLRAAEMVSAAKSLDQLEFQLRGLLANSYTMMYVENVEYLARAGILSDQHTFFSAMLGVKPLIAVENGQLKAVEKTRTRGQALDRLHEFAAEFGHHAHIVVQHDHESAEIAARLHERLMSELAGQFDLFVYNSTLSALVGVGAVVVAILETVLE